MDENRSLDAILAAFDLPAHHVQAFDPDHPNFDAQRPLLVLRDQAEVARPLTRRRYPPTAPARAYVDRAVIDVTAATLPLDADAWLIGAIPPEDDRRSIDGLRGVMERLFAPDGCPWDREQTHQTLRAYLIEETYELVDAIDRDDMPGLREEVGDVLAHMFMQTAIAQQSGAFTLEDAVEYATAKFVRRHPHVFGDEVAESAEGLTAKWEQIKAAERAERSDDAAPEGALDSVPAAAPALQRAQALIRRARRAGLVDPEEGARATLDAALDTEDWPTALFAVARVAADAGVDAEETLRQSAAAFAHAFRELETAARAAGVPVEDLDEPSRRAPWQAASGTGADRTIG